MPRAVAVPLSRASFRPFAGLAGLGFILLLATCRDGAEPQLHRAPVAVAPILPSVNALASFGLTLDRVRFIVVRPSAPPDTLVDTTANIPPDSAALDLDLHVALIASAETLQVTIVALSGSVPLFQGTAPVEVQSGGTPPAPTEIPVLTYVGPGAGVDSLAVSPTGPFIYFNDSLRFQVQAFQAGAPVTQFYVSWSTSDSTVARINAAGVLRAPTTRTSVRVIARTPAGVSASAADSTTATFLPVPNQLVVIAGGGQTAGTGQPLATQLEVEVRAADNLPVPGVNVRFRSLSGGTPADTTVTSDAQGRARVTAVLGSIVGTQTFQASLPAFPGVSVASFSATATGIVISPSNSVITVSSGSVISGTTAKLRLQTKDGAGNDVTTGGANVLFNRSGGGSTGTIGATVDSGNGVYTAVFTGQLAGTATTIGATINGAAVTSALPTIAVSPGAISPAGSVITLSNDTVVSGAGVTLKLRGKDAAGNNVAAGGDSVAFGFAGGASTGTIGATADSGTGVYTATFNGVLAGSATLITATINGSAVTTPKPSLTVIPGAPAQLAFLNTPPFATTGTVITPPVQVAARDLAGNATPSFTGNVTIAIGTNPSGGLLAGTLTQPAVAGIATFSDLAIDQPGVGYTLTASATGLTAGATTTFDLVAPGGSVYWIATAGGNWSNPANWNGGAVPGPTETAVISASGTYTVTLDVSDTIAGLQIGGASGTQTLFASSKTLRVSGTTQINANGTVQARNTTLDGGVFSNAGTLLVDGNTVINQSVLTASSSVIRITGDNQVGHSYLTVANGFTNNGHITLTDTVSTYGATLQLNAGTLTNGAAGTIDVLPGAAGAKNIGAAIDNQGTVNVAFPLALNGASAAHSNSGTINITGAGSSLVITQSGTSPSFTTTGTIAIAAGDTLKVQSGVFAYGAGTIGGGGIVSFSSVTASVAPVWNTGTAPLLLANTTINGAGSITNAAAATLDLGNSVVNIPVTNQGRLLATGGSARLSAAFTAVSGSTLEIRGNNFYGHGTLVMDQSWTNNGSVLITDTVSTYGATLSMPTATLTNAPGGTITAAVGAGGTRDLNVELVNQGSLTLNRTLNVNRASATHQNSGTIDIVTGNLLVTQSGTTPSWGTTGTVNVAPGDTFRISSGTFGYSGGSIGGGGVLSLSNVTANTTQPFSTATALLDLQNSTWNGAATLTNAPGTLLVIGNSTIATPFVNQGTFVARGGSSRLTGAVTTVGGSLMRIQGNNVYGQAVLNVTNSFTNNATLELTDTVSTYGAMLTMPAGTTLTNAVGATLAAPVAANGARTLTVQLDNQGTFTVSRDVTLNGGSAAHTNSGSIAIAGGNLLVTQSGTSPSFLMAAGGGVTIANGDTLRISGGQFNYTGGTISGGGAVSLVNTTANATQAFTTAVNGLDLQNATWGGTGVLTNAAGSTLVIGNSTIATPFVNQGFFVARGSISQVTGAVTTVSGSTIRVQGNNFFGQGTLAVANGFTNNATIELTDTVSTYGATLRVTAGTLTNASGATIAIVPGANGARTLDAEVDNQTGAAFNVALNPNQLLTWQRTGGGAAHQNSGTIDVSGGDVTMLLTGSSFTNAGSISIGLGDTVAVSGGTFTVTSGAVGGSGALAFNGAANATFNVAHSVASMLATNATVNFATPQSTGTTGFVFTSATINGPGTLTNDTTKTLTLQSSTINTVVDNHGTLIASGSTAFTRSLTTSPGSLLRLQGNGVVGGATVTFDTGFVNNGSIELTDTVSTYGATLNVGFGTLTNAPGATIAAVNGAGGARTLGAELDNQGLVSVALGPNRLFTISKTGAVHQNSGTIDITAGDVTINQSGTSPSFTNTGTVNIGTGDTLTVTSGTLNHNSGTLGGAGALVLANLTAAFNVPSSVAAMVVTNSTVGFATPQSSAATVFSFNSATINGPATFTNDPGQTLGLRATTVNAPFVNQGTLLVTGSTAFNDTLTTAAGSSLRVQGNGFVGGATLNVPKGFENAGAIELTDTVSTYGATLAIANGKLVNLAGGTITSSAGANGNRSLNAGLDNQGTFTIALNPGHAMTLSPPAAHDSVLNSGALTVSNGNLRINHSVVSALTSNLGAASVAAGDTLFVSTGTFSYGGGSLDGPGTLSLGSVGAASFAKPHTLGGILLTSSTASFALDQSTATTFFDLNGSTLNGPGILTNVAGNTLMIRGSTIGAALVNQGTLIAAGSSTLSGAVTNTGLVRVYGFGGVGAANLTVTTAGGFTNAGALELTDTNAAYGATLKVSGGTLVNAAGATIDFALGSGGAGARTLDAMLDNKGTLTLNHDAILSGTSPAHTNSGVMKVNSGNLTVQPAGANPTFTNLAGGSIDIGVGKTLRFTTGAVSNTAGALIDGSGTLDVSAPASFTDDGDLTVGGSPGMLTIKGTAPLSATANLNVEIGGTTPGTQYDQLVVTGSASWAGTLNVTLINGFTPTTGQQFILATCSVSCTNRFGTAIVPAPFTSANVAYVGNQIVLTAP